MSDTFLQTSDVVLTQLQNSFQKMPPKIFRKVLYLDEATLLGKA